MKRDTEIFNIIEAEHQRQLKGIELIASENFVSDQVMEAMGSCLTNKYAEGYPGKRYYGGCVNVDQSETIAIERAKKRMKRFVDENFKVEAVIKALDEMDKKGVKTCYVSTGSNAGITKGQIFEVFSQIEVAGEKVNKKIGELKAEEVLSGTLTKCSVKSGGDKIKTCFEQKTVMTVVSRAKKPGGLERLNNAFGL